MPYLINRQYLYSDGRVIEKIIDPRTNQEIPQPAQLERINGRIEPHPKFPDQFVLKYQESLTPKPTIQPTQSKTS